MAAVALHHGASARLESWTEHLGATVSSLQRQCDAEKRSVDRRFQQLERQLQGVLGRLEGDGYLRCEGSRSGERWAELQGSVTGLLEEVQGLARRVDSVDDRLWQRAGGAEELARQGARELQQQVQALERQCRLAAAAAEDTQRRQASRQRRTEKLLEDLEWRLAKTEEEHQRPRQMDEEGPSALEEQVQGLCGEFEAMGARLASVEALQAKLSSVGMARGAGVPGDSRLEEAAEEASDVRSALGVVEGRLAGLESKASAQLEEMRSSVAAVRVKVEGQCQRQGAIAERLEMAHVPTLEALRAEVSNDRARDIRSLEDRLAELGQRVDCALEAADASGIADRTDSLGQRVSAVEALAGALRREAWELRSGLRAELRGAWAGGRSGGSSSRGPVGGAGSGTASSSAEPTIKEQLGAVADQLEALDELADRVNDLNTRVSELEQRWDEPGAGVRGARSGASNTSPSRSRTPATGPERSLQGFRADPADTATPYAQPGALGSAGKPAVTSRHGAAAELDGASISGERREVASMSSRRLAQDSLGQKECRERDSFPGRLEPGQRASGPSAKVGALSPLTRVGGQATASSDNPRTSTMSTSEALRQQEPPPSPPSPPGRPPVCPGAAVAAQERTKGAHFAPQQQEDAAKNMSRCNSYDSQRSSYGIAISPDESVADTTELQNKCDMTEEVIRPSEGLRGSGRGSGSGFDPPEAGLGGRSLGSAAVGRRQPYGGPEPTGPGGSDEEAASLNESLPASDDEFVSE